MFIRKVFLVFLALAFGVPSIYAEAQESQFNIKIDANSSKYIGFSPSEHYLIIEMDKLLVRQNPEEPWYKKVFVNREDFGLAYLEFFFNDNTVLKKPLFKYRKLNGRYKYEYLLSTPDFPSIILDTKLVNRPFFMKLVTKNWKGKENLSALNLICNKLSLLGGGSPNVNNSVIPKIVTSSTVALTFIDELIPPSNTDESAIITINPFKLKRKCTLKLRSSDGIYHDFIGLKFLVSDSILNNYNGIIYESAKAYPEIFNLKDIKYWEKSICNADKNATNKNITPLLKELEGYYNYLNNQELTYCDKVILLAKSMCTWAPLAISEKKLSASHFYRMVNDNGWDIYRKYNRSLLKECNLKGPKCKSDICNYAWEFCVSSNSKQSRSSSGHKFINGSFELNINNDIVLDISTDEYINHFILNARSYWDAFGDSNNATFIFKKNNTYINFKNNTYNDNWVSINIINIEGNYFIANISISSNKDDLIAQRSSI